MTPQQSSTPESYYVAMKAFVRKGNGILILIDRVTGTGDLVGGRIGVGEFEVPLVEILRREIEEELGPDFQYRINGPVALFRDRRTSTPGQPVLKVLMIGFELECLGGEIKLSEEHSAYEWLPLEHAEELLPDGQKEGLKKYRAYRDDPQHLIQY